MESYTKAQYIWLDGSEPTQKLRGKTMIVEKKVNSLEDLPDWGVDGSSTNQAVGDDSDCLLKPVYFMPDPTRMGDGIIVMCEVYNADGTVHASNHRAKLREISEKCEDQEPWFGIEQEYTFFDGIKPLGWPDNGFPAPQGGYYCGVGSDEVYGRDIVEDHLEVCLSAGIRISGINAEVMPAQWEFQVGPCGPLEVSDQLWIARWLLYKIGEDYGVSATLDPKPMKGDWNGAGAHTNFSTKAMRDKDGDVKIHEAIQKLETKHYEHIQVYGDGNNRRLTGMHETCPINRFHWGVSDRGASVRVPWQVAKDGKGYFEDRRPAANCDPYIVCSKLIDTICGE